MNKIMIILSMMAIIVPSSYAVTVSINPAQINTVDTGSSFKVDVWVYDVTDLGAFQFDLTFNSYISSANGGSVVFGNFIESPGRKIWFKMVDDTIPGRLSCTVVTEASVSGVPARGPDGDGILATITFQRQSLSDDLLSLEYVNLSSTLGVTIPVTTAVSEISPRYHITANVKAGNGSIFPSGDVLVKPDGNQLISIQPEECCYVADVKVDGVSKGAISSYTFLNVNQNHTIEAYFGIYEFTIIASAKSGGTIGGIAVQTVNKGASSMPVTAIPNNGYMFVNWTGTNGFITTSLNPLVVTNVTDNMTITANFQPITTHYVISGYIKDSSNNPGIGVTLTFSNNGGTAITDSSGFYTKTVSSDWSGTVASSKGSYTFTPASRSYTTLTSDMPDQNYTFVASNKAVIVAGGGDYSTNGLWKATKTDTDYAYSVLTFQGYKPENIRYLSAQSSFTSPVSGFASKTNLHNAITSWASDANNLLIYIADHGGNGTFRMNETEILSATELDAWLDTLQQTIPGYVILIYDACQSGSFVNYLIPPAGKRRIVAASTSVGENAIFASEGTLSFGWLFWSQLYGGISFYQAFLNAQNSMSLINPQNSVIEADGDGVPGGKGDSAIAATVRIGDEKAFGADFPLIGIVSPPQTLTAGTSATIFADQITDADGIRKVWAVITPPQNTGCFSADTPVTSLPTAELYKVSDNRYEGIYNGFFAKGTYKVAVFATDINDFTSLPVEKNITSVTQTQSFVKKGDITGDNQVNLADVISALQVLSGLNPAQILCDYSTSGADVNGDGRVGLQEVIYILQTVVGLR